MKAVNKLKSLRARNVERRKAIASIYESPSPTSLDSQSVDEDCTGTHATVTTEAHLATETEKPVMVVASPPKRMDSAVALEDTKDCAEESDKEGQSMVHGERNKHEDGHALLLPKESVTFLNIGVDGVDGKKQEFVVTESPARTPEHIYEEAYEKAVEATSDPIPNLVLE